MPSLPLLSSIAQDTEVERAAEVHLREFLEVRTLVREESGFPQVRESLGLSRCVGDAVMHVVFEAAVLVEDQRVAAIQRDSLTVGHVIWLLDKRPIRQLLIHHVYQLAGGEL